MKNNELLYLWHPGTQDIFSGYGLSLATSSHLVGIVMIDRPTVADPAWLENVQNTFGAYQLTAMTHQGERGIVCQMRVAEESTPYLKTFNDYPLTSMIRTALLPLLNDPPAITLALRWDQASGYWVSTIVKGGKR
jgi:hypothetical protein